MFNAISDRAWRPWEKRVFTSGTDFAEGAYPATGKRVFDVVVTLLLLVPAVLLLIPIVIIVAVTSPGPILYTQERLGWRRRSFTMYKIRTMLPDCERLTGPRWCTRDDPRITPVGRFLRRSHLDELPQLWNILKGDMSLVGPRPERPEFVAQLEKAFPSYTDRLLVRPGLTGLAQVQLPADIDHESVRRKLLCDRDYLRNVSFWLDLRLMICTGLFCAGVPFPVSCRLFRVHTPGIELEVSDREVELVSHSKAVPAWHDS